MAEVRDWNTWRTQAASLLERRTGEGVETWKARVRSEGPDDEKALKAWLGARGVDGYARMLLVMERFGYPDFLTASADELVDAQSADRPALRPIYDALLDEVSDMGEVTVQARKGYVSLLTPRRTFARVQPTTKSRIDVALRLDQAPEGRLAPHRVHEHMPVALQFSSPGDLDEEAISWLRRAYDANL